MKDADFNPLFQTVSDCQILNEITDVGCQQVKKKTICIRTVNEPSHISTVYGWCIYKIDLGTRTLYIGGFIKANTCMCIMYPVLLEKEPNTKDPDDAGNTFL